MPWDLAIHHIDLGSVGDATVIVAKFPAAGGNAAITRSVLIDGGKVNGAPIVDAYLQSINIAQVDVIIVTHFDEDHFYGISRLLQGGDARYNSAILYDCGRLPADRDERSHDVGGKRPRTEPTEYSDYRNAALGKVAPFRYPTAIVNSFDIVTYDAANDYVAVVPPGPANGRRIPPGSGPRNYLPPHWLIGKDVMWGNGGNGQGANPPWAVPAAPAYAPNRPTLVCVTANKYVMQNAAGNVRFISDAPTIIGMTQKQIARDENANENAKSLGFILTFNNFRYYVAGDLESPHEDGYINRNCQLPANQGVQNGVMFYLNGTNTIGGRVLAMKASHHGARTASSRAFISRMRPSAAFISTGAGNKFYHPAQRTINVLDGYPEVPTLGPSNVHNEHPPKPPPAPQWHVPHYLTGYQNPAAHEGLGGDASQTAGDPPITPGHIRIEVSETESTRSSAGQAHRGTRAAAHEADAETGLGLLVFQLDDIAEAAASLGVAQAVAKVLGLAPAVADSALRATALMGKDYGPAGKRNGIAKVAVTAAPGGAAAVANAVRNLAADPARWQGIGNGVPEAIGAAVTGGNAAAIRAAALGAAAPASAAAADAAAAAADTARVIGWGIDDRAYAVAAAFGAVAGGATETQAAAIAAAITATVTVASAIDTAAVTATAALHQILPAPMANAQAAVVGAVAGASHWLGVPQLVNDATRNALIVAGFPANAVARGNAAGAAATLAGGNTLFHVHYTSVNGVEDVLHTE